MFEELLDEIEKEKDDKSNSPVNINLSQNMFIISDLFKQKMKELNSIPENELIELVKYSYQSILDHISTTTDPNYISSFTTWLESFFYKCYVMNYNRKTASN